MNPNNPGGKKGGKGQKKATAAGANDDGDDDAESLDDIASILEAQARFDKVLQVSYIYILYCIIYDILSVVRGLGFFGGVWFVHAVNNPGWRSIHMYTRNEWKWRPQ